MPVLGKYALEVLLAYGVSLALLGGLIALTAVQARRARQRLEQAEQARNG